MTRDARQFGFRAVLMGASPYTGNRGVSALASSLVDLVYRSRPDASVTLLLGHRDHGMLPVRMAGGEANVAVVNYRLSPRAALQQQLWVILLIAALYRCIPIARARKWIVDRSAWVRALVDADFVGDIRGGDSFSDIYGVKNFLMGCLPVLSVIWVRGGIHLLPQSYGPFRSRLARRLARYILLRTESIWSRDRIGLEVVARLTGGRRRPELCPDVAFALTAITPELPVATPPIALGDGTTLIGLNVNGLVYNGGYTRSNMFGLRLDYPLFVEELVKDLLSDPSNRVLLVPHTAAPSGHVESDTEACRKVLESLPLTLRGRAHLLSCEYDQHELKGIIGRCDFFVGSRMHACIAALSQGVPTVGVAYSPKFAGVFETVGASEWVVDGRTTPPEEALERVRALFGAREANRIILTARVAGARRDLERHFQRLSSDREKLASTAEALTPQ